LATVIDERRVSIARALGESAMDIGMLIVRTVFGLLLAAHGCQKLFGWFGGEGLRGTATFFERLGFYPGQRFVVMAALGECGGGALLALGFLQPAAAAPIVSITIVALATVHWGRGLLAPDGIEHPFLYLTAVIALAITGPGAYSLDAVLGLSQWWTPHVAAIAIGTGIIAAVVSLAMRRTAATVVHA
jgi:putative oxidoreductase